MVTRKDKYIYYWNNKKITKEIYEGLCATVELKEVYDKLLSWEEFYVTLKKER